MQGTRYVSFRQQVDSYKQCLIDVLKNIHVKVCTDVRYEIVYVHVVCLLLKV